MTHYIDAEKLRIEIKRRLADYSEDTQFEKGERYGYKQVLSFLNTLQEPEVDLEEEADRMFFSLGWYEGDHHQPMLDCVSLEQFRGIARHFAEWGKKTSSSRNL